MKAILTGHTRGLGAAIAEQLLARDIPVLGLARSGNAALAARYPALLTEIALDLSDPATLLAALSGETVKDFVASAQSLLLINNAGMLQPVGRVERQDAAAIARTVSLNVAAPLMHKWYNIYLCISPREKLNANTYASRTNRSSVYTHREAVT